MAFRHLTVSLICFYFDDCYIELMLKVSTLDILFYCFSVDQRLDKEVLFKFLAQIKEREEVKKENWHWPTCVIAYSPLANRGLVSGLRFLDSNEEQFHLLYANCSLQWCTAIWAPCNALATTSACVLQSSSCSLFKEGVFLQTVFKFSIGSTSRGRPEVKMSYPESLTSRCCRVSLISSIIYKYIGIWTIGVLNRQKKTYLVSLDSTCTQRKTQADAILVRSERCIVGKRDGQRKCLNWLLTTVSWSLPSSYLCMSCFRREPLRLE